MYGLCPKARATPAPMAAGSAMPTVRNPWSSAPVAADAPVPSSDEAPAGIAGLVGARSAGRSEATDWLVARAAASPPAASTPEYADLSALDTTAEAAARRTAR